MSSIQEKVDLILCVDCGEREVTRYKRKKICNRCYQIVRRGSAPRCTVEGCNSPQSNRIFGLCDRHNNIRLKEGITCRGQGGDCGRSVVRIGLCITHHRHFLNDQGIDRELRKYNRYSDEDVCDHPECDEKPYVHGVCEKHRGWWERENRPDEYREQRSKSNHARRAKKLRADDDGHSDEDVIKLYGEFCYLGNERVAVDGVPIKGLYNKEHVLAYDNGGDNTLDNVRPSCMDHNFSKGTKLLVTYLAWREPDIEVSEADVEAYMEECRRLDSGMICVGYSTERASL